jgi:Ser/Thr protein kinase RdoA (MazF antagonist)
MSDSTAPGVAEHLSGGGTTQVLRVGETVRRPHQPWSPRVHQLLAHLAAAGFTGAPRTLGTDEAGRDVFGYLAGEVGHYPWTPAVAGEPALLSAARLLRAYHDATADVAGQWRDGWRWEAREPVEVVCHNDFAPYNCVFDGGRAVGVIDFDTAGPGPRTWDLAYALYRFAPLSAEDDGGGVAGAPRLQAARARAFLDAYGGTRAQRAAVVAEVVPRLRALTDVMRASAAAGDAAFARHIAEGHLDHYLRDIAYLTEHGPVWDALVVA